MFQIPPDRTAEAVTRALRVGYRHVDTAQMYGNEKEVGDAVRAAGIDRAEVFVTSKLNNAAHRPDDARRAFDGTLEALGLGYVDLFLIHWPLPTRYDGDYVSTWRTLAEFARGRPGASVGVSNFQPPHLQRIIGETGVVPAVNQVEVHPYFTNEEVRAFARENGIVTEAWSPIAQGAVLGDPDVASPSTSAHARPGRAALALAARRRRVPQVGDARADRGELRALRLRARRRRHDGAHQPQQGRGGPHGRRPGHLRLPPALIMHSGAITHGRAIT